MSSMEKVAYELRAEADVDFISLPFVIGSIQEEMDLRGEDQIRQSTLEVVKRLIARDVYPGDYDYAADISLWTGAPGELLKRIDDEWTSLGKIPDEEDPICWFALRPSQPA